MKSCMCVPLESPLSSITQFPSLDFKCSSKLLTNHELVGVTVHLCCHVELIFSGGCGNTKGG